jgi:hypothetical protein
VTERLAAGVKFAVLVVGVVASGFEVSSFRLDVYGSWRE